MELDPQAVTAVRGGDHADPHGWLPLDFGHYPAGEPFLKGIPYFCENDYDLLVRTADIGVLNEALMFVDAVRWRHGDAKVNLHLPHFPGARQDRLNTEGDMLFTARSVAEMINRRDFQEVWVVDPHSDVVPALVDNIRVVSALDCIKQSMGHPRHGTPDHVSFSGVIAPDGGAEKRALKVATWLGVPLFQAWKTRDIETGKISGFGCEDIPPLRNPYLVVDDLCDGGGTFLGLAGVVDEGVTLDLYVTHGLFTKGVDSLHGAFDRIFTTDSTTTVPDDVFCIDVAANMKRIQS